MVEEVFQDRGKSLNPNGIDENQRLRRPQGIGIARDGCPVDLGVVVSDALLLEPDAREGRNRRSRGRYATVTTCLCSAPKLAAAGFAYKIKTRSGVPHR